MQAQCAVQKGWSREQRQEGSKGRQNWGRLFRAPQSCAGQCLTTSSWEENESVFAALADAVVRTHPVADAELQREVTACGVGEGHCNRPQWARPSGCERAPHGTEAEGAPEVVQGLWLERLSGWEDIDELEEAGAVWHRRPV